jgi:hypothetical protein
LILAEAEFESDEEMQAFPVPSFAVAEVTRDVRFTGGRLVRSTHQDLAALLAQFM